MIESAYNQLKSENIELKLSIDSLLLFVVVVDIVTLELHHFLVVDISPMNITIAVPYNRPKCNTSACLVMGDLNIDQLNPINHDTLINLLESNGFCLLNSVEKAAFTRRSSKTILEIRCSMLINYQSFIMVHPIMQ